MMSSKKSSQINSPLLVTVIILFLIFSSNVCFARMAAVEYQEGGGGGGGDPTPPTTPEVFDDGDYTNNSTELHASWSSQDPQSGIAEYKYGIGTTAGATDIVAWTQAGLHTEVTHSGLALMNCQSYYFTVKAKNGRGLWSQAGNSDGIIVDTTVPVVTAVIDDGEFTYDRTQLHASWQGEEDCAPIVEYQYAIGTMQGESGTDIVNWTSAGTDTEITVTGLSLSVGQIYYFNVKAKNASGLWSVVAFSNGIIVLNQTPEIISLAPENNSTFTEGDIINIEVQAHDPDGDILEYRYLVDSQLIQDWTLSNTHFWQTQTGDIHLKTITVEVRDVYSAMASSNTDVFLYRRVPEPE